jgi:hypothetical protein
VTLAPGTRAELERELCVAEDALVVARGLRERYACAALELREEQAAMLVELIQAVLGDDDARAQEARHRLRLIDWTFSAMGAPGGSASPDVRALAAHRGMT